MTNPHYCPCAFHDLDAIAARFPCLLRAMKWAAILSTTEGTAAIRDLKHGYEYSGEAVGHFGGASAVIRAALRCRHVVRAEFGPITRKDRHTMKNRHQITAADSLALPGMESADHDRAEAAAVAEGEALTAAMRQPLRDISAKSGQMERNAPLFYGTGNNPTLFGEGWDHVGSPAAPVLLPFHD